MGVHLSKHGDEPDDGDEGIYFPANSNEEVEEEEEMTGTTDDEMLAQELQRQELLLIEMICARETYCNICMESKPPNQFTETKFCSHKFCQSCIDLYVSSKLDENSATIGCPEPGCKGAFDPLSLQFILPRSTFERWCGILCQSMIKAKFYCPYSECSALLEAGEEEEEVITVSKCPHCNRLFCAQCRVPWHHGRECREVQQLREDEKVKEDLLLLELASKLRWQRCPKCRITVERIDGCKFMRCRCGDCFCYTCASPMSQEDHYCYKCKS
ncbi:E3 ubiquitin-protein ligase [Canna indica]|uniref:RBR-type E3 ubiquitin transferase n=1 Tax=Canna indica TaxID=4628 RepID=A0AAQ3L6W5_9LILI|nr:E3 ubiquitin-protein ligase [Canna indica]